MARTVPLAWDASTDPTVIGYTIYAGPLSRGLSNSPSGYLVSNNVGNVLDGTITIPYDSTWYFAIGAYDAVPNVFLSPEFAFTWSHLAVRPMVCS